MKRKTALILSTALLLFSHVAGEFMGVTLGDPFMPANSWSNPPTPPSFNVQSPSEKLSYWVNSDVWLDFAVTPPLTYWYSPDRSSYPSHYATSFGEITYVGFSVDGQTETAVNKVSEYQSVESYSVNIGRLSAGQHTIRITAQGSGRYGNLTHDLYSSSNHSIQDSTKTKFLQNSIKLSFTVNQDRPTTPPNFTLISPSNKTYYYFVNSAYYPDSEHVNYVGIRYRSDDIHLSVGYSFDKDTNIIAASNGTKISIPITSHSLTLHANDSFGNQATQTAYFEILPYESPTYHPKPPQPLNGTLRPEIQQQIQNFAVNVFGLMAAVVAFVICTVVLLYFKIHKKRLQKS
jgi:hypothetical protein